MQIIFFGSPRFAEIALEKIIKGGIIPSLIVCNIDKLKGRKKIMTAPETKVLAEKYKIPVFQSEKLNKEELNNKLTQLKIAPDLFIVAAYSKILKKEILEIPKLGTIGVHPSLLPKFRGATPIQSAILSDDEITGVTIYFLNEGVDSGEILKKREVKIKNQDYLELEKELAEIGGNLIVEILPKILKKEIKTIPQNEKEATYTKKFSSEDGFVGLKDLNEAVEAGGDMAILIDKKIRAIGNEPGVYIIKDDKRIKLLSAEVIERKLRLKIIQEEGGLPKEKFSI
ncbi:MAG: methionyl-tRNA formyltransferase [Candidatus Pacebacteria bacterium]|nr:methionyl-tRNA formyltransferase [Candidatus Paceibacterota bacterium]